jgi:hypothetical protein
MENTMTEGTLSHLIIIDHDCLKSFRRFIRKGEYTKNEALDVIDVWLHHPHYRVEDATTLDKIMEIGITLGSRESADLA